VRQNVTQVELLFLQAFVLSESNNGTSIAYWLCFEDMNIEGLFT